MPCAFLGGVRRLPVRVRAGRMANVGAQPTRRQNRHAWRIFHVGDCTWRIHGLCADHLLHHGLRLFRRGHGAQPPAAGTDLGMGRVLDRDPRRSPCPHFDRLRSSLGAVHVLPAAYSKRLVLHRAGPCGCGIVGLVRADAGRNACMESRQSRPTRSARHVRDRGQCGHVALDDRRRGR